jgi:hypothetical protein
MFLCFLAVVIPLNVISFTVFGHSVNYLMGSSSNYDFQMIVIGDWVMKFIGLRFSG